MPTAFVVRERVPSFRFELLGAPPRARSNEHAWLQRRDCCRPGGVEHIAAKRALPRVEIIRTPFGRRSVDGRRGSPRRARAVRVGRTPFWRIECCARDAACLVAAQIDDVVAVCACKLMKLLRPSKRCSAKVTVEIAHLRKLNGAVGTSGTPTGTTFSRGAPLPNLSSCKSAASNPGRTNLRTTRARIKDVGERQRGASWRRA
jgi:hypothetical protein